MNWFDIILLIIVFASFLSGLKTGFARVVFHLIAICFGFMLALWCYGIAAEGLSGFIHQPLVARIAGFCLIFFGVMIIGSLLGWLFARIFQGIGLAWLDHLLGGAAGLVRGALLVAFAVTILLAFLPVPSPAYITESRILPYATSISGSIIQLAPIQFRSGFTQQLEHLKQLWMQTAPKSQRIV